MKKIVLLYLSENYADWETAYLSSMLNSSVSSYELKTFSLSKDPVHSMGGLTVLPDYSIDELPQDFSMLILAGGLSWSLRDPSWMNEVTRLIVPLLHSASDRQIPIAAICDACSFLAEQGLLDSIPHTGNSVEALQALAPHYQGGPHFVSRQALSSSGIVTANGTATLEFTREILLLLDAIPQDQIDEWYDFHHKGFYPYA